MSLNNYEISIPVRVNSVGEFVSHSLVHNPPLSTTQSGLRLSSASYNVGYRVPVAGKDLHLTVAPSSHLLGPGIIFERRQAGRYRRNLTYSMNISTDVRSRLCHFQGHIRGCPHSMVAISTCKGLVSCFFILYTFFNF